MGELKVRIEEEMTLRGLRPRSKKSYLFAVRKFVEYHGRSPAELGQEEVRAYLVYLLEERKLAASSVNQAFLPSSSSTATCWAVVARSKVSRCRAESVVCR